MKINLIRKVVVWATSRSGGMGHWGCIRYVYSISAIDGVLVDRKKRLQNGYLLQYLAMVFHYYSHSAKVEVIPIPVARFIRAIVPAASLQAAIFVTDFSSKTVSSLEGAGPNWNFFCATVCG